jgi:dTDP-4-amino-4,6-dideoxygalactose transaminase
MPRVYLSPPHLSGRELDYLRDAIDSNWVAPLGPHVDAFEAETSELTGVPHALALSSGTAALHLALVVLGIGAGDEVACSSLTFSASANPIRFVGATPVFVDATEETWTLDPELLRQALEERPQIKAVVAVDLYGQCCDYDAIRALCTERGVALVQDAAESLGATYREEPAGAQGDLAVFSFNGNKVITTSGGGMLVSRNDDWIAHARKLSTQAREPAPHYEHTEIGFNYRLSNLLAAVGRAQLEVLPDRVAARRRINARYRELLPDVEFMPEADYGTGNCWLTCVLLPDPERVRLALEQEDIESRPLWKPMHLQPVYEDAPVYGGEVSARLFERGLCLPSGSALGEDDQRRVVETLLATRA